MMLPLQEILNKYNVHPKGVIHVGAHWAEEHNDYLSCGLDKFVYIEPCKEAFEILVRKFFGGDKLHDIVWDRINKEGAILISHTFDFDEFNPKISIFRNACGATEREMPMYVSHQNQGQSNSLLEPVGHLTQHPEIVFDDAEVVKVVPLDRLIEGKTAYQMLVMDVQGYEGEVLKGATETLKYIDIIYAEINRDQTYKGNMLIGEMEEFLKPYGFKLVEQHWPSPNWSWGDGVFIKQ